MAEKSVRTKMRASAWLLIAAAAIAAALVASGVLVARHASAGEPVQLPVRLNAVGGDLTAASPDPLDSATAVTTLLDTTTGTVLSESSAPSVELAVPSLADTVTTPPGGWPSAVDASGRVWIGQGTMIVGSSGNSPVVRTLPAPRNVLAAAAIPGPYVAGETQLDYRVKDVSCDASSAWVSRQYSTALTRMDLATGATVEIPVPPAVGVPDDVAVTPDGGAVWMTSDLNAEGVSHSVLTRYDAATGAFTVHNTPSASLRSDAAGTYFLGLGGTIHRIDDQGVDSVWITPRAIRLCPRDQWCVDAAGKLWVATGNTVARYGTDGALEAVGTLPSHKVLLRTPQTGGADQSAARYVEAGYRFGQLKALPDGTVLAPLLDRGQIAVVGP